MIGSSALSSTRTKSTASSSPPGTSDRLSASVHPWVGPDHEVQSSRDVTEPTTTAAPSRTRVRR
jgi:hypothetical protein